MKPVIRRSLAVAGTLALSAALVLGGAGTAQAYPDTAAEVDALIFSNDNVVDTSNEYLNELSDLETIAGTVTPFDGGDGSVGTWLVALSGKDLFVLPEQENDLFYVKGGTPWISDAAYQALKNWVDAGGIMIVNGSGTGGEEIKPVNVDLLNGFTCLDFTGLLGTVYWDSGEVDIEDGPELDADQAQFLDAELQAQIDFELLVTLPGAPDPLASRDGTYTLYTPAWPAAVQNIATNVYASNDPAGETAVVTFGVGAGAVLYLGYDWWELDSDQWYDVLTLAVAGDLPYKPQAPACALAATGSEVPVAPFAALAGALLLAGAAAVVVVRRRAA